MELLDRLKERKLVQWALAYLAAAWLALQLMEVLAGVFAWTGATQRTIFVLLLIGLPVVLVLAWYHGEKGRQRVSGPELIIIAALLGLGALGTQLFANRASEAGTPAAVRDPGDARPSVAMLPLANRSGNAADVFFTDGIHDDILSQLAKIASLKVISRTSVEPYRNSPKNLRTIGRELGAEYILEGGLQRGGDRVRITVQLIDAASDLHLWAETYDREMTTQDIFAIQSDIASRVARALEAELTSEEATRLEDRPTDNLEAYEFYLRANSRLFGGYLEREIRYAIQMYARAVDLDPDFAVAHARQSDAHAQMYWFGYDRTQSRKEAAQAALAAANALAPDHHETRLAAGFNHYYLFNDYERALQELELARQAQPSHSRVLGGIGYVHRRLGEMQTTVEYLLQAAEVDPNAGRYAYNLGETYVLLREFREGEAQLRRAIELIPDWPRPPAYLAMLYVARDGDTARAQQVLEEALAHGALPVEDGMFSHAWYLVDLVARDYEAALSRIRAEAWDVLETQFLIVPAGQYRGELLRLMGDDEAAEAELRLAASYLEARLLATPDDERLHSAMGHVQAGLGEYDAALAYGARGVELMPADLDAYKATYRAEDLARIQMAAGRYEEATTGFTDLLNRPSMVTTRILELDPRLEALRRHPGFQALLAR